MPITNRGIGIRRPSLAKQLQSQHREKREKKSENFRKMSLQNVCRKGNAFNLLNVSRKGEFTSL